MDNQRAKVRVARLAESQFGRITWAQLQAIGVDRAAISKWCRSGYLHRQLPHVYAVGHRARTVESDLAAAVLYAGPGAMLSHATAAWWLGLIEDRPRQIHVTTPRRCRSLTAVRVHDRRPSARITHLRLPTTTIPLTLLDLAATAPLRTIRRALANADYQKQLDVRAIEQVLARGRHGAAMLHAALEEHQPRLARTKSRLERLLIELCEREGIPVPEINTKVAGWETDALWPAAKLAVELDGYGNHHTPAQLRRDRRKEMALRTAGLTLLRYSEEQLVEGTQVAEELRRTAGAAPQTP